MPQTKTGKRQFLFKVLYAFLSLTLALVIAIIVWMVNGKSENSTTPRFQNSGSDTLDMPEDKCLVEPLVGDGYCDFEANVEACNFDSGDCCQLESDLSFCPNCTCWLSNEQINDIIGDNCLKSRSIFLGDGVCDLNYNHPEYFFDIGDCCQPTPSCRVQAPIFYSMVGNQEPIECPDNPCIPSNNYCIPDQLGDGICQDHNNGPYCDYDHGDCCWFHSYDQECCDCSCYEPEDMSFINWPINIIG